MTRLQNTDTVGWHSFLVSQSFCSSGIMPLPEALPHIQPYHLLYSVKQSWKVLTINEFTHIALSCMPTDQRWHVTKAQQSISARPSVHMWLFDYRQFFFRCSQMIFSASYACGTAVLRQKSSAERHMGNSLMLHVQSWSVMIIRRLSKTWKQQIGESCNNKLSDQVDFHSSSKQLIGPSNDVDPKP